MDFVVHARVGQAVFHHLGDRGGNHILFDAHLLYRIIRLESGLFQIFDFWKAIGIDNNTCCRFGKLVLGLSTQRHSSLPIHRICRPGCTLSLGTDVYLETGNTCQRALRGADICRIIGECTDVISYRSRNC